MAPAVVNKDGHFQYNVHHNTIFNRTSQHQNNKATRSVWFVEETTGGPMVTSHNLLFSLFIVIRSDDVS